MWRGGEERRGEAAGCQTAVSQGQGSGGVSLGPAGARAVLPPGRRRREPPAAPRSLQLVSFGGCAAGSAGLAPRGSLLAGRILCPCCGEAEPGPGFISVELTGALRRSDDEESSLWLLSQLMHMQPVLGLRACHSICQHSSPGAPVLNPGEEDSLRVSYQASGKKHRA